MELDRFLDDLSSDAPVPGGGSVAALSAALGAALVSMVGGLTVGRKRYADVEKEAGELQATARELMRRSSRLIDEDASAFRRVSEAMSLPRDTDEAKSERTAQIQTALKGATEPPLETMRVARDVMLLAQRIAAIGNKSAISDAASAALMAAAAFEAARLNVEINLASVHDAPWVGAKRTELEGLGNVAAEAGPIVEAAGRRIRGETA
ncbi:MAG TPA: cyclodeaminase/cyclohydrolase family protein [Chloroflexota bacterium]|nr:cyclodeaminase/cyclohydrolase family protein [Chloroflexota bacterium]